MHLSKEISDSPTFKFAQAANEMKSKGKEIISLGLGEPDFKTPDYIVRATIEALHGGYTHYSVSQGLPELREHIAREVSSNNKWLYDSSEVIILPGVKAAVHMTLAAILEPFDEVINITPYYVSYPSIIKLAEPLANIVHVPLKENFTLDIQAIEKAITPKTKCILLNTPSNPTGVIFSKKELDAVVELSIKNNFFILSDEVYDKLIYKSTDFISLASYAENKDRIVVTNGYSKSYAMTGWRLGYAVGPKEIIRRMNKINQHINTNTCTFIQKGACSIYENNPAHLRPYVDELILRTTFFYKSLKEGKLLKGVIPQAGFFCFVDISETGMDSNSFCVRLLQETGIASTPGIAFGDDWDKFVRFSIAVPMQTIERAMGLLNTFTLEVSRSRGGRIL